MTLTSVSLHEYLTSKGDFKTKSLHFSMPISLREAPNSADEFELKNNFAMVSIKLDLVDNFEKGLKQIKQNMDKLKRSIEPFAMYYFIYLATLLPSFIANFITKFIASKMSLVFSNVPGPKKPFTFVGK